jgi:hypothetical protein
VYIIIYYSFMYLFAEYVRQIKGPYFGVTPPSDALFLTCDGGVRPVTTPDPRRSCIIRSAACLSTQRSFRRLSLSVPLVGSPLREFISCSPFLPAIGYQQIKVNWKSALWALGRGGAVRTRSALTHAIEWAGRKKGAAGRSNRIEPLAVFQAGEESLASW